MNPLKDQLGLYQDSTSCNGSCGSFRNYLSIGVLALSMYFLSGCGGCNSTNKAYVKRVIDGDTVVLSDDERVRLLGINTPEKKERGFKEAKGRLEQLVLNKEVELEGDKRDREKYGRLGRYIFVDGVFINQVMVEEGYAEVKYADRLKYQSDLLEAQERHEATHKKGKCDKPF